MKNLLFISSYPCPLYKGSNQHAYFFLKSLASIFNVYCIFFVQPENKNQFIDNLDICALGIKEYDICFFKELHRNKYFPKIIGQKYYEKIRKTIQFPYGYMNMATHLYGKRLILKFIQKYSIEIVHFEHFHYVKYLLYIPSSTKRIVVYHDLYHLVDWEKFKTEKKIFPKLELLISSFKKYLFENYLEYKTDLKIFLNPVEMQFSSDRAAFIPHIVNPEIKYNLPKNDKCTNILFLGGYNHPPNRVSVKYIVDKILPLLVGKIKDFKIWVIGPGAEKYQQFKSQSAYGEFIYLKGFVSEINAVFQNMSIALFPILYGGGIKTKVIEAMAAGIPVITSPQGVFGLKNLPENCVEVCRSPDEFFRSLMLLSEDLSLRQERSKRGKHFVNQNHSVEKLSSKIKETYHTKGFLI